MVNAYIAGACCFMAAWKIALLRLPACSLFLCSLNGLPKTRTGNQPDWPIGGIAVHHRQIANVIGGKPLENREKVLVRKGDAAMRGHGLFNCCRGPLVLSSFGAR